MGFDRGHAMRLKSLCFLACLACAATAQVRPGVVAEEVGRGLTPGALFAWDFHEQAGGFANNILNPSTTNNVLSAGERVFQIPFFWNISAGSFTITDNFVAGPNNSSLTASRLLAGGASSAIRTNGTISLASGQTTVSAWMKLN